MCGPAASGDARPRPAGVPPVWVSAPYYSTVCIPAKRGFENARERPPKPPLQGAAESNAACGGYSETEQVQRSQNASVLQRTQRDAGTANRTVDAPQGADGRVHCRLAAEIPGKARQGLAPHPQGTMLASSRNPCNTANPKRRAKSPALHCHRERAATHKRQPSAKPANGPMQSSAPTQGAERPVGAGSCPTPGHRLPSPVPPPVCLAL